MTRTLTTTTIVVAMFVATAASAITVSIDTDKATYLIGEDVMITLTAVASGVETAGPFSIVGAQVTWDSTKSHVKNSPAGVGFGASQQLITAGPNAGGIALSTITTPSGTPQNFVTIASGNPFCANDSMTCAIISQVLGPLPPGDVLATLDAQTLVGTLVLQADAVGLVGLGFGAIDILGVTTSAGFTIGTNFATAAVVAIPEPGSFALFGVSALLLRLVVRRRPGA